MPLVILTVFIGVPIIEIVIFIEAGGYIGLGATLALVILTAIIGTELLRAQGMRALHRAQAHLDRDELPVDEVFTGLCLLLAGALLLTPGFLTDAVGFALFLPLVRGFIGGRVIAALSRRGGISVNGRPVGGEGDAGNGGPGTVIEGEYADLSGNGTASPTPRLPLADRPEDIEKT